MKIDLEQEKFLKRLDLRISTLCSVANHFEKLEKQLKGEEKNG